MTDRFWGVEMFAGQGGMRETIYTSLLLNVINISALIQHFAVSTTRVL
jgi:hypothetical protein